MVNPKQSTGRPVSQDAGRSVFGGRTSSRRRILIQGMGFLDPIDERRSLAEFYARMTDGELQKLDGEAESLTDLARDVLEEEIERRGLDEVFEEAAALDPKRAEEVELRKLITIRKFRDLPEALLAKGSLESAGIECFLADENLVRLDWFISNFVGGIKLQVKAEDAHTATELLEQPMLEGLYVEGVGLYWQPRCPKCQSLDISFQGLNKPVAYASAYLGVPIPLQRNTWKCHSCEAEWEEVEGE